MKLFAIFCWNFFYKVICEKLRELSAVIYFYRLCFRSGGKLSPENLLSKVYETVNKLNLFYFYVRRFV